MLSGIRYFAQNPSCSNGFVYMDGGSFIKVYDPSQPISVLNPSNTTIPTFGGGLALMPNINGGTLTPTFYSTSGGNYWYWNGVAWTNTGHSAGNGAAVNIAGCAGTIYNLVGGSGQVYSYNGSGNGSLLTTLTGFNGGGPYDLVTDCNCNFYALKTSTPNQALNMYSPTGALLCTYTLSGMPNTSAGGGFAIVGNMIYVRNSSFYAGTISGGTVTFTNFPAFSVSPGDFASCPVCYGSSNLVGASISGVLLGCTIPTANIVVSTTASPVTYNWSGPGIIGSTSNSFAAVGVPGSYTCVITSSGCPPQQATLVTTALSNSVVVLASVTPSGNICVGANVTTQLVVAHTSTTDVVLWNGPGMPPTSGIDTLNVNIPGTYTVQVTDIFNGCKGTDFVTIAQNPTVSMALSDNTLCLQSYNGSSNSIVITPSGALNYTLLTSSNYSTSTPNGPTMSCFPVTISGNLSPNATATLIGANGFCNDTTTASFIIIANPSVTLSNASASICPGGSKAISASGATQYVWSGSTGLNTYSGNNVIATPNANSLYSVIGSSGGCNSQTQSVPVIILPIPTVTISPATSTICLGSVLTLTAGGSADSFAWSPPTGLITPATNPVVYVTPPNTQIYSVIGYLNSCTNSATALVNIVQPPLLSLTRSSTTLCAQNFNNSPTFISLVPSGAQSYTLLAGSGLGVFSPNGPNMQATPTAPFPSAPSVVTTTLIGKMGVCTVALTETVLIYPNPTLLITPPSSSICPTQSQAFTASGASSYTWLPMPNYTLTGNNSIVASPLLTSFYSVIGSHMGCGSDVKNAVLIVLPIPNVSISPASTTVCAGNSVVLNAVGNAVSYNWSPSGSLSVNYGSQVVATPSVLQTYTVLATLNTCTNQAFSTVSVIVVPVIHATASQSTICSNSSTKLNITGANTFKWLPEETLNASAGSMVTATPNQNTTYTVHGYNGICTGSTTIFIKTVQRPDMELITGENRVCFGSSVPISVRGAQSYTWSPANALIPTGSNTTIIANPKENTNYNVIGANSIGTVSCYQSLSYSVSVVPVIQPMVSPGANLCQGEKVTLYAYGGNSFSWTPAYGLNITNRSGVVANPLTTTLYTVEVSENTYCGKTTTIMVTVSPKPTVFAGRDTSYNMNDAIFINAVGTGTLMWIRGEEIICSVCPLTQVYPTRDNCYVIEAINEEGCRATDDICIALTEDFTIYIPNAFSPNNDGLNDKFLIFGENISKVSLEIYDRWGVKIFSTNDFYMGWDGYYKGELCPLGSYTYVVHYTGLNRKKYTKTGNINLTR